jgi:hypothetical protein
MTLIETAQLMGNFGEFFGAVAVVVTLAYLVKQIRDQNHANEIAAFEGMMDGFNQMIGMMAADKTVYRTFIRGLNEPDALDDDEAGSFQFLLRMYLNNYNKIHRAYQRGALTEREWSTFAAEAAQFLESPGGHAFLANQPDDRWEYLQAIQKHLDDVSVVDISLGRNPLRRAS